MSRNQGTNISGQSSESDSKSGNSMRVATRSKSKPNTNNKQTRSGGKTKSTRMKKAQKAYDQFYVDVSKSRRDGKLLMDVNLEDNKRLGFTFKDENSQHVNKHVYITPNWTITVQYNGNEPNKLLRISNKCLTIDQLINFLGKVDRHNSISALIGECE